MNNRKSIYISGPITGRHLDDAKKHFNSVHKFLEKDWDVYNPILNPERNTWAEYMRDAIAQLVKCDYVIMLNGWCASKGACLEYTIAKQIGIEVVYEIDMLPDGGTEVQWVFSNT